MIYLDNSATSYPKPTQVVRAVADSFAIFGANPGRSGHSFSIKSATKIAEIRQKLCNFVNAESAESVIFTSGCTEALNLAILGSAQQGGHVVCTANDHNSTLRPLFELQKKGVITLSVATPQNDEVLTLDDILPHIKPNTYLVCVNHISNVDGMRAEIEQIGRFCHKNCILFLVDGAQSVGHTKIDMLKSHIDFLTVAGHKALYGPMGVGALVLSAKAKLLPIKFGGTGTDSISTLQPTVAPEAFESGTLPTPNIIGLGAGIDFVQKNFELIQKKLDDLTTLMNYELCAIKGVKVFTHHNNANGLVGFNVQNLASTDVCDMLDAKYGIMTRGGLHCAPLRHKCLGTQSQGVVRASISYFTTYQELQKFFRAVKQIAYYGMK